ncbi:hypothetical protein L210DRAFT_3657312 [Boletus edulis BED1]|uniref:PIN domain-containing protein n=1 Tax=Boletus edulis BED1 TaxID=1328754 RepID=A0AAD4BBE0_BOLED|nr:hypothetical protein L210DRAFT_3657312 [Boletus edulis BED1]
MEWVGREVFERGFWKSGEDRHMGIEVLDTEEGDQLTDGIIQDEDADERGNELKNDAARQWIRITRATVNLAGLVDGFTWVEGTREWKVDGTLEAKVRKWRDEDRHEREQEEIRRRGRRWTDDTMDIDVDDAEADESSEGEDALSIVASIIESLRWTVVIPVSVIMELDGLCHYEARWTLLQHIPAWRDRAGEKLQDQIDAMVGWDGLLGMEDSLPLIIYQEALRYSPAVPLSIPHAAVNDDMYDGYHNSKGCYPLDKPLVRVSGFLETRDKSV